MLLFNDVLDDCVVIVKDDNGNSRVISGRNGNSRVFLAVLIPCFMTGGTNVIMWQVMTLWLFMQLVLEWK